MVPASNVSGDTTDLRRASSGDVGVGKLLRTGRKVLVPAEPATVASVDVHDNIGQVELLEGVGNTRSVSLGRVLAGLEVDVGDQVGQRVGLNNQRKGLVGV